MLHLLTDEYKKKVSREYAFRVWIVVSLIVLVISILSALFIAPAYLKINAVYNKILAEKEDYSEKIKSRQDDNSVDGVRNITNTIAALKNFNSKESTRDIVLNLVSKKQKGISLSHIAYGLTKSGLILEVAGKAETRSSLVAFSDQLKKDVSFTGVTIPLSSFAREKDIDFSLKLSVSSSTKSK